MRTLTKSTYDVNEQKASPNVLSQIGDSIEINSPDQPIDLYSLAVELAAIYRLKIWDLFDELKRVYGGEEIFLNHVPSLSNQIEEQTRDYEVTEEQIEKAIALVKFGGFDKSIENGAEVYTAEISYPIDKESLLQKWEDWKGKADDFGFHYTPYNFDSHPELDFFEQLLDEMNL